MTLRGLIEAVEAGAATMDNFDAVFPPDGKPFKKAPKSIASIDAGLAFHGSLDAAKRLHDALLPGWKVAGIHEEDRGLWWAEIRRGHITSYDKVIVAPHHFNSPNPARAWLLAILRALDADQCEGGD